MIYGYPALDWEDRGELWSASGRFSATRGIGNDDAVDGKGRGIQCKLGHTMFIIYTIMHSKGHGYFFFSGREGKGHSAISWYGHNGIGDLTVDLTRSSE